MIIVLLASFIVLLLPNCGPIKAKREFHSLQTQAHERVGATPKWNQIKILEGDKDIINRISQGISLQDAVEIALRNNPDLQSQFDDLGIAKSNMIQAGLYTNPRIESFFKIPIKGRRAEIETEITFTLSDLWQVPLKKQVAQDELEIKSLDLLHAILKTAAQAKHHYLYVIYAKEKLKITQKILKKIQELRDRIYYRQQFGYTTDLDKYFADVKVAEWQINVRHTQAMVTMALIELRRTLGITMHTNAFNLKNQEKDYIKQIPELSELEHYALETRPKIQIARLKVLQARHKISLERSKIFDNTTIGISHKREFEINRGLGPSIGLDIPLFNTNYGAIERAKYELKQAKKTVVAEQMRVIEEVQANYEQYQALHDQIKIIKQDMIPASKNAIAYTEHYFKTMQLNMITLLDSYIALFEVKKELVDTMYHAAQARIELEKSLGTTIDNFNVIKQVQL